MGGASIVGTAAASAEVAQGDVASYEALLTPPVTLARLHLPLAPSLTKIFHSLALDAIQLAAPLDWRTDERLDNSVEDEGAFLFFFLS